MSQGSTQYAWLAGPARCCGGAVGMAVGYRRDGSTYRKRGIGTILDDTWPMAWLPLSVHLHGRGSPSASHYLPFWQFTRRI